MGIKGSLRIEKERWRLKTVSAQTAKTKEVETFFYSQLGEICNNRLFYKRGALEQMLVCFAISKPISGNIIKIIRFSETTH